MEFKLGSMLKDKVTGMTGIAMARVEYLNGCIQYGIKTKATKDGKYPDTDYIDVGQLELVGKGISVVSKATGGDMSDRPRGNRGLR